MLILCHDVTNRTSAGETPVHQLQLTACNMIRSIGADRCTITVLRISLIVGLPHQDRILAQELLQAWSEVLGAFPADRNSSSRASMRHEPAFSCEGRDSRKEGEANTEPHRSFMAYTLAMLPTNRTATVQTTAVDYQRL